MAQRAIILSYHSPAFSPDAGGLIDFQIDYVGVDTISPLLSFAGAVGIRLSPANPATWTADIKAVVAADAVARGLTAMVVAGVFAPTYA